MEDFVPYKLAVKLEQKGFKQGFNIFGSRPIYSDEETIKFISDIGAYEPDYFGENISCPTISQVLKWLRDKNATHIDIVIWDKGWYYNVWLYEFYEEGKEYSTKFSYQSDDYESYEDAALAGIEYVLDNLI